VEKLLRATLDAIKKRGEPLFTDVSKPYAYTLVAELNNEKVLVKISNDIDDIPRGAIKDIKILSSFLKAPAIGVLSTVRGQVLLRGVVYRKDDVNFVSLSTLIDYLDGKMPIFMYHRGRVVASVDKEVFGERRRERGLSYGALSERLSISRETLYRYERGEISEVSGNVAEKLIEIFGADVLKPIKPIEVAPVDRSELLGRAMESGRYRLVESHPNGIGVEDRPYFISTDAEKYRKTLELADVFNIEVVKE